MRFGAPDEPLGVGDGVEDAVSEGASAVLYVHATLGELLKVQPVLGPAQVAVLFAGTDLTEMQSVFQSAIHYGLFLGTLRVDGAGNLVAGKP